MNTQKCPMRTGAALTALDPEFRENPLEYLNQLRSVEPVHRDGEFDRVVLTRAEDVGAVLDDRTMFVDLRNSRSASVSRSRMEAQGNITPSLLEMDGPNHKRWRDVIAKEFNQKSVKAMRLRITEIANKLLDQIEDAPFFDVVDSYAKHLPALTIAEMFGVDEEDHHDFKIWSDAQMHRFNPLRTEEQLAALSWSREASTSYFAKMVDKRRKSRTADLISILITAEEEGRITEPEIVGTCQFLMNASSIATTYLIANGVLTLLKHPDELAKLLAHPELAAKAVEEILRFSPPIVSLFRMPPSDTEIGGVAIDANQSIMSSILAANCDPDLHENPEKFDIERARQRHYSFGGGAHFCVGALLAREEAQVAIPLIFSRFPKLRLMPERPAVKQGVPGFNGLESLWVAKN